MHWRRLLRPVLAALLLLAASTQAALAAPGKPGTAWDYVALGDSLATGFGAIRGYVPRYKGYAQTDTGKSVKLNNLGQNGWTSADLLNALKTNRTFRQAVSGAEVLTWNIGGNDLRAARDKYKAGTCGGTDNQDCLRGAVAAFKSNWDATVREILALRSVASAVVRTTDIYNPYVKQDQADGSFTVFKRYLDDVNGHIATTAGANGIQYAAVYLAFNGASGEEDPVARGYIGPDGLHPNDTGHTVIADLLRALGYSPLG